MQRYHDLVELARICLKQACKTTNPVVAAELMRMATGYQLRAATLDDGRLPDISESSVGGEHRVPGPTCYFPTQN